MSAQSSPRRAEQALAHRIDHAATPPVAIQARRRRDEMRRERRALPGPAVAMRPDRLRGE
jgi:hypothetical protein